MHCPRVVYCWWSSLGILFRALLNAPIIFADGFRCSNVFENLQLFLSYTCTLPFLFSVVYSLSGQFWNLGGGIAVNSVDIPKVAILSQALNQMERTVLSQPMWERGHSVDFTMLRPGQHTLWCHRVCELSSNFYFFLSLRFVEFISIHYFIYLETRSHVVQPHYVTEEDFSV